MLVFLFHILTGPSGASTSTSSDHVMLSASPFLRYMEEIQLKLPLIHSRGGGLFSLEIKSFQSNFLCFKKEAQTLVSVTETSIYTWHV